MKKLEELQLHEQLDLEEMVVIRVPGGWIYKFKAINVVEKGGAAVFVPERKSWYQILRELIKK